MARIVNLLARPLRWVPCMKLICPHCKSPKSEKSGQRNVIRAGVFQRKSDGHNIRRFRCLRCLKYFSRATLHPAYRQKKRHLNETILRLLGGGVCMREAARILGINRKTIARKKRYLALVCGERLARENAQLPPATQVEFDDLETFEHTKCKPVSIPLMVEYKTRRILAFEVAQMPAKGLLAQISRKKYGYRADHRPQARKRLFESVKDLITHDAVIRSDSNPHYREDVKRCFPQATHETVVSRRGAITAQGELKKQKWDPIFSLNHTCAMFRAHVSRLIRKTWNTTKKIECLRDHLMIYAFLHNRRLKNAG